MKYQGDRALKFAKRPAPDCRCVLVFGDDEGVVGDTADAVIKAWQSDGPASIISYSDDEVSREPAALFDALEAQSLLGEASILRIRTGGEKLFSILKDVLAICEQSPERMAARLIVQSGALNTKSKTRTAFEAGTNSAALHVFSDSSDDIAGRVRNFLSAQGVEIDDAALFAFVAGLPGHRSLANAEMEKLSLYADELGRSVSTDDIRQLCETNADESARAAVMLALDGQPERAQAEMDRVLDAGLSPIGLVRMFEMEASRMLSAHRLGGGGNIGMKLKPPVWKSEWPAFQTRLRKWPMPRLVRLIEHLHDLEHLSKMRGGAADAATRRVFTLLYKAASQAR